ncbi:hypothetical protein ACFL11_00305 [Patescibacteria group bacterium]
MNKEQQRQIWIAFFLLAIFGIAMGVFEAATVVYIRELGKMDMLNINLYPIELTREVSTIAMLVIIAVITGKNFLQRFSFFIYTFAFWDIFYYVAFHIFISWPPSLSTWDVLFLIPIVWQGPVIAPIFCSLMMILLAIEIVYLQIKNRSLRIDLPEWTLLCLGGSVILLSFLWNSIQGISPEELPPPSYNWLLFGIGTAFIFGAKISLLKRENKTK